MNPTLLNVILALLGGTNVLSLLGYWTERKRRIHQANITKHEAEIKEADALDKMRASYTIFVDDMNNAMALLREEKDLLKKELDQMKKESRSIQRKLNNATIKCNGNCFIDEKQ